MKKRQISSWIEFLDRRHKATKEVKIGLVGKYDLQDAYKSILEALSQAATYNDRKGIVQFINSEYLTEDNVSEKLSNIDGIVIGPGFGLRGTEGKFIAAKYARTHNIPTFGICFGMQCMVIEFARNVLGYSDANSTEMNEKTTHNVIDIMEEQNLSLIWVEQCVWELLIVLSNKGPKLSKHTKKHIYRKDIVIAMNSIMNTKLNLRKPV